MEQQGGNLILMAQDEPNSVSMWYSPNIKVLSAHENSVRLNRWTHIAYTVNSGTMTVYINGELSNSTTEVSAPQIQTGPVAIGKRSQAANRFFDGTIDELGIWNRAFSSEEIRSLYKLQIGEHGSTTEASYISTPQDSKKINNVWQSFNPVPLAPYGKELAVNLGENINYDEGGIDSNGLVSYWNFNRSLGTVGDGTIYADLKGNNAATTSDGASTSLNSINGKLYQALELDGSDDFVRVNDDNSLQINNTISISAWVKPTANITSTQSILGKGNSYDYWLRLGLTSVGMHPSFLLNNDASGSEVISDTPIPLNTWTFLVGTYDGVETRLYVNGVLVDSKPFTAPINTSTDELSIGATQEGSNFFFQGAIDEVSLWSRALSATEVSNLYKRGVTRIKYQVRSCSNYDCSGEDFIGPDQTSSTFFTELDNTSSSLPSFDISSLLSPNRFIQYRAVLETDDGELTPLLKSANFE